MEGYHSHIAKGLKDPEKSNNHNNARKENAFDNRRHHQADQYI